VIVLDTRPRLDELGRTGGIGSTEQVKAVRCSMTWPRS